MVGQYATNIVAVGVPFVVIFRNSENVIDSASEYPVSLPSAVPPADIGKSDYHAFNLFIKIHALVSEITVNDFCPLTDGNTIFLVFKNFSLILLIFISCVIVKIGLACPDYQFLHSHIVLDCCLIVYAWF